jgi:RNA polymerase sigma factor (sigma-70 family)
MVNLTELVKNYKKTKNNQTLEQILKIINKDIEKRVELIYRKLKFYQIEREDIKQELYIKILTLIDTYDPKEPFENYLFSSLKNWKPKLSKDDTINFEPLYKLNEETGEEVELNIEDKKQTNVDSGITLEEIFKECKTEEERKICQLYLENPEITEEELAKKLGTYKMNISRIINRLRKKLSKKFIIN